MITECLGVGGAERAVTTLALALEDLGYTCEIAALWGPYTLAEELRSRGIAVHALDVSHRWRVSAAFGRLTRLIREIRPSVVHAHGYFPLLYSALTRTGCPGPRRVVTFHSMPYFVYPATGIQQSLRRRLERVAARHGMHAHIAVSSHVADHVAHHLALQRPAVILNPVEQYALAPQPTSPRSAAMINDFSDETAGPLVLCPATLRREKNHRLLLTAMRQAKCAGIPARLIVAGDGPLRGRVEAEVIDMDLSNEVRLVGKVEHRALIALVGQADLVAVSSIAEGGPIAILEAMAQGTAVLSTAVGCLPEVVETEVSGILVATGDDDGFCSAFSRLLQDRGLRDRLASEARSSVEGLCAPEIIAARHDEVYRDAWRRSYPDP
ncbi:MAG: glycosyltransferase family 4 protein [Solirubrobacteraceae bacterium]